MRNPDDLAADWDMLATGITRPAVIKGLNVPIWYTFPIVGLPILISIITWNPIWLAMMAPLTAIGRWIVANDHNRPWVKFLALFSRSMFADRRRWGGDSPDPHGPFIPQQHPASAEVRYV